MPALQLDKLSLRAGAVRQSGGGGCEGLLGSLTKGRPIGATSTPALPSLKEVLSELLVSVCAVVWWWWWWRCAGC